MPEPDIARIVILANSRKLSGRCIAGKDPESGIWYRPVGDREDQAVAEDERRFQDGSDPRLLDLVDVPLRKHMPSGRQPENWLLDPEWYWELNDRLEASSLPDLADRPAALWLLGSHTVHGVNDRVPEGTPTDDSGSLALVRASDLRIRVVRPGETYGSARRQVRGRFNYSGITYDFAVTDPITEREYLAQDDGEHQLGERWITVSLAEAHKGFAYKLIAAVFDE